MARDGQGKEPPKTRPDAPQLHRVGRRGVMRLLGFGAFVASPLGILPPILRATIGRGPVHARGEPARAANGRIRQWVMVIDLRFCDGCQKAQKPPLCTTACIEGHYAPEPMEWIQVFEGELPGGGSQFIPTPCQHCQNAPCNNVCPVGATFATPEGTILIDQNRCIGCRICMAACPYDRRFFNWGTAPAPPESMLVGYDPEHQAPAKKGTVMKCDFCPDMARTGVLPYCAQGCPNQAIYFGDLEEDLATNGKNVVAVLRFLAEHQAYRLKEHMGTKPRVYYIPGHGEAVGRDVFSKGRLATRWPWIERIKGARTWKR